MAQRSQPRPRRGPDEARCARALGITAEAAGLPAALVKTLNKGAAQRDLRALPLRPSHDLQPVHHRLPRFAAQDWPLERLRAIGKSTGTTLNDVVLAMCSGALRTYLMEPDALPDAPLVAMVPVGLNAKQSHVASAGAATRSAR